jgi:hypothetical protein
LKRRARVFVLFVLLFVLFVRRVVVVVVVVVVLHVQGRSIQANVGVEFIGVSWR